MKNSTLTRRWRNVKRGCGSRKPLSRRSINRVMALCAFGRHLIKIGVLKKGKKTKKGLTLVSNTPPTPRGCDHFGKRESSPLDETSARFGFSTNRLQRALLFHLFVCFLHSSDTGPSNAMSTVTAVKPRTINPLLGGEF